MDIIRPDVHIKWFAGGFGLLNKVHRTGYERGRHLGAVLPPDRSSSELVGAESVFSGRLAIIGVAQGQYAWTETLEVRQGCIKSVFCNERCFAHITLTAHMPLAEVSGGVARSLEHTRQHRCPHIQPLGHTALLIAGAVVQV